jgi:peroxiredoxin Q/BCP
LSDDARARESTTATAAARCAAIHSTEMTMLGKKVADFTAPATGAAPFRLSAYKGHPVVLYFYPKDNTPGCTTEGTDFRDRAKQFAKAGAVIVGISRDSLKSHEGFKAKMGFPFELVSDADENLCVEFGVIKMKNMYGRKVRGIERSTFVVDGKGVLVREWRGVRVPGHVDEVLAFVQTL